MAFESIEQLKLTYTDKFVEVTGDRPELARFSGVVGRVKTVNMSGRALVQFEGYLNNPAWYDIELSALRVVDPPPPPETPAKRPAKAAKPKTKPSGQSAVDVVAAARAGTKPPAGDKPKKTSPSVGKSTADILAAARGGAKSASKKTSPSVGLSTADVLAAARGQQPVPTEKKQPVPKKSTSGMTTEEILAAARAANKPTNADPESPALDKLEAESGPAPEGRRRLTAADIRDIGLGKLQLRREPQVATEPLAKKALDPAEAAKPDALPEKVDTTKLTAADILAIGRRK